MNFYNFLRIPLSFSKAEEPPKRPKSCLQYVGERLESSRGFSLVYIQVDKGDVKYISDLVNGKAIGPSQIGVIVREGKQNAVYSRLDQLANAEFDSSLKIAVETISSETLAQDVLDVQRAIEEKRKKDPISAVEIMKRVRYRAPEAYELRNYRAQRAIVGQEQPSPLYPLPVPA